MSVDAEKVLALIAAARAHQPLPAEIGPWLAKTVLNSLTPREAESARNVAIRKAASLVSGTPWNKATALRNELAAVRAEWTLHICHPPAPETLNAYLVTALTLDPDMPSSVRHLLRILDEHEGEY